MLLGETTQTRLTRIGLERVDVTLQYVTLDGERRHRPDVVNIGVGGMFFYWPTAPADLVDRELRVEWLKTPFTHRTFVARCRVVKVVPNEGVHAEFGVDGLTESDKDALSEWIFQLNRHAVADRQNLEKTAKWYTLATVISAAGLVLGGLGLLLPPGWWSKTMLFSMILSIFIYATFRFIAGRYELKAIREGHA